MLSLSVCVLLCCIVLPQNIKCDNQHEEIAKIAKIAKVFMLYGQKQLDAWKRSKTAEVNAYKYANNIHEDKQKLLHKVETVHMYAVAGILSMGEIKRKSGNVKGVENHLKQILREDCKRVMFLNNAIAKPPSTFKKEDHQEKQLVDNYFLQMKECYERKHPDDKGVIILYSLYIPCYGTGAQKYDCAMELKNYVTSNKHDTDRYKHFYVVYSRNFRCPAYYKDKRNWQCWGTNEGQSTETMLKSGMIKLGRLNEENNIKITWMKLGGLLQQYLYDCLIIYSTQCNHRPFGSSKSSIVAYAVNFAMSKCVDEMGSLRPSELSQPNKNVLKQCLIKKWIKPYIPENIYLHNYATLCVEQAILFADSTGRSPDDLSQPLWHSRVATYEDVVAVNPEEFKLLKQSRKIKCSNRKYLPETLCTSANATATPKPPQRVRC